MKHSTKNALRIVGVIVLVSGLITGFQNCSPTKFASTVLDSKSIRTGEEDQQLSEALISINDGALYTNDVNVRIRIQSPSTQWMMFTNESGCKADSLWKAQSTETAWILGDRNKMTKVFARFKTNSGNTTDCISASISHDDKSPVVQILKAPTNPTQEVRADFEFDAVDEISGISHYECRLDLVAYRKCDMRMRYDDLAEGSHSLDVVAVDYAGNRSAPVSHVWFIDHTRPVVNITKGPAAESTSKTATFEYVGSDPGGSGVASYICELDGVPIANCESPKMYANLKEAKHSFSVSAIDRAGNKSGAADYSFEVTRIVPGDFSILGVTAPPKDTKKDFWLAGLNPTVSWTASNNANEYKVSIFVGGTTAVACNEMSTTQLSRSFDSGNCVLQDGRSYTAQVVAVAPGGATVVRTLDFKTDVSGPEITLSQPIEIDVAKKAVLNLSIKDNGELASATCTKHFQTQVTTMDCLDATKLEFDQPYGDHSVVVTAVDKAGNTSTKTVEWQVKVLICDPFTNDSKCDGGLSGDIFYLTQAQYILFQALGTKTVNYIIENGVKAAADLRLSSLNIATRAFTNGFPTGTNMVLKTEQGQNLIEYFALRLNSVVKLNPTASATSPKVDAEGWYQLATLSDDGVILKIRETVNGVQETLINADGDHATQFKCAQKAIYLKPESRVRIDLDYYQGPREHIALQLLWRKVERKNDGSFDLTDSLCNASTNDGFFGPAPYNNFTNTYYYGQLLDRGWRTLSPANYISTITIK